MKSIYQCLMEKLPKNKYNKKDIQVKNSHHRISLDAITYLTKQHKEEEVKIPIKVTRNVENVYKKYKFNNPISKAKSTQLCSYVFIIARVDAYIYYIPLQLQFSFLPFMIFHDASIFFCVFLLALEFIFFSTFFPYLLPFTTRCFS